VDFCRERRIPHEICGKVVVAEREEEVPALEELRRRGTANGVPGLKLLSPPEVREIEPHVRCVAGLLVPTTGIVHYGTVAAHYAAVFEDAGGRLHTGTQVIGIRSEGRTVRVETTGGTVEAGALINCGGLHSDRLAEMSGVRPGCRIVPFRGEYYTFRPERARLVNHLIYPVPDPRFPFLGVHFTRMIDGEVEAGPNAVLAFAREGYAKRDVSLRDLVETLTYPGFLSLCRRYWKPGLQEMVRSFCKKRFVAALRRLMPDVRGSDLHPGGAGVRAQALGTDGKLLDDFVIRRVGPLVHVLNAPSPAATSSLAIADHVLREAGF
jgi:L-2-hydroxyglutarate oxidase LhgO